MISQEHEKFLTEYHNSIWGEAMAWQKRYKNNTEVTALHGSPEGLAWTNVINKYNIVEAAPDEVKMFVCRLQAKAAHDSPRKVKPSEQPTLKELIAQKHELEKQIKEVRKGAGFSGSFFRTRRYNDYTVIQAIKDGKWINIYSFPKIMRKETVELAKKLEEIWTSSHIKT